MPKKMKMIALGNGFDDETMCVLGAVKSGAGGEFCDKQYRQEQQLAQTGDGLTSADFRAHIDRSESVRTS
jgi:hypothetical protein